MNELKFTGKYSTLENLREAFPNGGSLGDFATIKGISYYYNPILSDWTTDYPESLFTEKNAYDEIFLGDYPDLGLVWKDYPNGGGQGNYITISGIKYFWNERDRKWEIGIGENIPPGLPEGDPNKFYNEQGKFVYVNTSKYVIYGNYIDDIHFQSNGKDAELKTDTLYIDKDTLKSYIYVNNKLIKTGLTEEEILRLFKKTSVTNTALVKIYSSDGFGLKSDGTTAGLTGYHVYRYNLSSYMGNGVWSAPLKKVAVTGVSSPSTAEEFCLACAYDKNDVFLKAFYVRTGQNYTKQVLEMPANAQYVRVCGTDALMPACYEVEDRWIFYTTEEVDALLANFNTEVHHDLTLKGNGKPDSKLSVAVPELNTQYNGNIIYALIHQGNKTNVMMYRLLNAGNWDSAKAQLANAQATDPAYRLVRADDEHILNAFRQQYQIDLSGGFWEDVEVNTETARYTIIEEGGNHHNAPKSETYKVMVITSIAITRTDYSDSFTKTLLISKSSLNGYVTPNLFSYHKKIKILAVKCESNCDNFNVKIGATTYDKGSIVGVEIPAETEVQIIDVNILAGMNAGNIRIIFKEI